MEAHPPETKPVVYVFHGDDPFTIKRHVETMIGQLSEDRSIADMNITRLDGRQSSDDDLFAAANAMPFLAERRMVILTHPFARLTTDAARKRFLGLLDGLPASTALVLAVEDELERGKWKSLPAVDANWMRKWISRAGDRAYYQLCSLPRMGEMAVWIRKEAESNKGKFTPEGAAALAAHVGNDTQLASMEIVKLLTYVDNKRPVDAGDVEEMTAQGGQADVFAMVDAMAVGNARQALHTLHRLLETQDPLSLFGMIVRQFRLLLQTRELLDEGRGAQISAELHVVQFVADKMAGQARYFSISQLETIYHRLLLLDETMKTSQMPSDVALDAFFAELAR